MKENNSCDFFDDSEAVIRKVTSANALEEEDSKPDTSDAEGGVGSQGIKERKVLEDDTLLHELAASSSGCYRCLFCGESFDNTDTLNEHVMKSCDNVN